MTVTVTSEGANYYDALHKLDVMRAFRWDVVVEFAGSDFDRIPTEQCIVRTPYDRREFKSLVEAWTHIKVLLEQRRLEVEEYRRKVGKIEVEKSV